ncbi:hypothetical protein BXZ70DRAFT_1003525 [Cristinia sonorae]|uniref:Uncharacterized protein n=1 Tax=Cristinia sonorae TaxID=1940300 RepID=A0A8K0XUW7_9AGAR|nr:hypothetical protein BXZ70DRAFT_1003525 [Cristinia sonorae]
MNPDSPTPLTTTATRTSTLSHRSSTNTHRRQSPPPPTPHPKSRFSINFGVVSGVIPTPDLLSSIPSGAHYVGATPTSPGGHGGHGMHRRSSSRGRAVDDPEMMERVYKEALDDLKEMYSGRATLEILHRRWRKDAEFEDSWCSCKGFDQYAPPWFALPKMISKCEDISVRILSANLDPNRIVYAQTVVYTFRWFNYKKTIESIVVVDFDEEFKVIRLVDQLHGEHPSTRWGFHYIRKFNAKVLPWFVRIPKDKTS